MLHIVTALHETLDIFNSNITFAPGIVELNKLISASANIYVFHCYIGTDTASSGTLFGSKQ